MKKWLLVILGSLCFALQIFSRNHTVTGFVKDSATGETLTGVEVVDVYSKQASISNTTGLFQLKTEQGNVMLSLCFPGYKNNFISFNLIQDTVVEVYLVFTGFMDSLAACLKPFQKASSMSLMSFSLSEISSLPNRFGKSSIIKPLYLLPGNQADAVNYTGIVSRGSTDNQNEILLDDIPVSKILHSYGNFPVINSDMVSNINYIKSGVPAYYGGQLSSVTDIKTREGNYKEYTGSVSPGLLSTRFLIEGPVLKDRSSFILTAHRSFTDLLLKPLNSITGTRNGYCFYDIYGKANLRISNKGKIQFGIYSERDILSLFLSETDSAGSDAKISGSDFFSYLKCDYLFTKRFQMDAMISYLKNAQNFNFFVSGDSIDFWLRKTGIISRINFEIRLTPVQKINFGTKVSIPVSNLNNVRVRFEGSEEGLTNKIDSLLAYEFNFYAEDDISISDIFYVNAGFHLALVTINNKESVIPEPRISTRLQLTRAFSVRASYTKMHHFPTGVYLSGPLFHQVPDLLLGPQLANQLSFGLQCRDNRFQLDAEVFKKTMSNLFESGDKLINFSEENDIYDQEVSGFELLVEKYSGRYTGWFSYTYTKANKQNDLVNNGKPYPNILIHPHVFTLSNHYFFSSKFDMIFNCMYYSKFTGKNPFGRPVQSIPGYSYLYLPEFARYDLNFNYHKYFPKLTANFRFGLSTLNQFFIGLQYSDNKIDHLLPLIPVPYIGIDFKF